MTTTPTTAPLLLPGQAAVAPGPNDLTTMYAMHHAFRRDLAAFAGAAQRTPAADTATWVALRERWARFSTYLHHHHTIEDAHLWPLLLARVDAADRAVLAAMAAEHGEIDPLLDACAAGIATLAAGPDEDARAGLEIRLVAARQRLGEHLAHEERDALPLIQRHLGAAEWVAFEERSARGQFSLRETLGVLPWVLHRLPADAVRRLAAQPGARPLIMLGRHVLRHSFERRERAAFRY
ncbi:hemerythrin domain-containing protein [Spirilliplanes yamanashiensis]|nr:hemerythrin domain-containing protein [Spirilliplanes yamanashiensis]MDP9819250.1 iron-sulfur cluster repair protein YtfE (RIC family) [Spirilliplanes yamanashiensis]